MDRRNFMGQLGAIGAGAAFAQLGILGAQAAAATNDYKALVCVFLFGGNDGNNTLVPLDTTGYGAYAAVRGTLALPQSGLVPLQETNGSSRYGLHPQLSAWQSLWDSGHLALLLNVGTLMQPLTKAGFTSSTTVKPTGLFSHSDQQAQWQSSISNAPSRTGWGGRIAEQVAGLNSAASLPALISATGPNLFVTGAGASALTIPVAGTFGIRGFDGSAAATARMTALKQLLALDRDSDLVGAAADITSSAMTNSAMLGPILSATNTTSDAAFAGLTSNIARQLLAVSKLIEARATFGLSRQIFMVSLGSFDTHTDELNRQAGLFSALGPSLRAFHDALVAIGASSQVTTFSLSDFSRTLQPNTGGGTDHAWGNHHFVMGGAVKGRTYYGNYPTLALNGPDDAGAEGRWIPGVAVDQYAATLAKWFGVSASNLAAVLPNLARFGSSDLGFMASS
jgi:uncharacterized protein (DUF1501 family)